MRRTEAQNNALHLWLRQCAEALNDAGYSVMHTMRHDAEIPWTEHLAKELLWRSVQQAMTGEESTAEQDKMAYPVISETIARHIAQNTGVVLPPWPTESEHKSSN